jgi:hypothetical protein
MLLEVVVAVVTVFSFAVAVISAGSYRRSGNMKVLIAAVAFALMAAKGVGLTAGLLVEDVDWEALVLLSVLLDAAVVVLLFTALVLRKGRDANQDGR